MATSSDQIKSGGLDVANIWGSRNYDDNDSSYKMNGTQFKGEQTARVGFRFTTVNVPQGATINSAELRLFISFSTGIGGLTTGVFAVDSDDAAAWASSSNEPLDATLTTAFADTTITTSDSGGYNDFDVTAAVQEVVNRGGWSANNDMAFVTVSDGNDFGDMDVITYEGSPQVDGQPTQSAILNIDYTEASTGTNMQINIGDVWKEVSAAKINIGDVWKDVEGIQINIGDTWKTVL